MLWPPPHLTPEVSVRKSTTRVRRALDVVLRNDYALSYAGVDAVSPTSPKRRSRR